MRCKPNNTILVALYLVWFDGSAPKHNSVVYLCDDNPNREWAWRTVIDLYGGRTNDRWQTYFDFHRGGEV